MLSLRFTSCTVHSSDDLTERPRRGSASCIIVIKLGAQTFVHIRRGIFTHMKYRNILHSTRKDSSAITVHAIFSGRNCRTFAQPRTQSYSCEFWCHRGRSEAHGGRE